MARKLKRPAARARESPRATFTSQRENSLSHKNLRVGRRIDAQQCFRLSYAERGVADKLDSDICDGRRIA
jgi:hypothetical protein